MMVRALCDLKKGDELTTSYKPSLDMSFEERNAFFVQRHQFECDCRLCHLERQEAPELRQKRKGMVDEYK
jgi:SET domain-containing protein